MILVFDNCEHVVDAAAELADTLLEHAPGVRILATSREPLRVRGERVLRLDPLTDGDAAALFADRAELARDGFTLSADNANVVHEICRRLDRLPLAIELAAAQSHEFAPDELARHLDDRFALLATGMRGGEPRQRTLRAVVDWSHSLLTDGQRALLRRLAVFAGGFTRAAAEHVCGDPALQSVASTLAALADRSLVVVEEMGERYRLLETIRDYAEDRLRESGEYPIFTWRHAELFAVRWERTVAQLYGPRSRQAHDALEADLNDVRRALERADPGSAIGIRLAIILAAYSEARGSADEARRWVQRTLVNARERPPTAALAELLQYATWLEMWLDNPVSARKLAEENLALCHALDEPAAMLYALQGVAASCAADDPDRARRSLQRCLVISSGRGDSVTVARTRNMMGELERTAGNLQSAVDHYQAGLSAIRDMPGSWLRTLLLVNVGVSLIELGDIQAGQPLVLEAARFAGEARHYAMFAAALGGLAASCVADGDHARAARLLGTAASAWSEAGHPPESADRGLPDWARACALDALGDETFQELFDEGKVLPTDEAVELVSSLPTP